MSWLGFPQAHMRYWTPVVYPLPIQQNGVLKFDRIVLGGFEGEASIAWLNSTSRRGYEMGWTVCEIWPQNKGHRSSQRRTRGADCDTIVALFFLLPVLRLYATRWVMTDLRRLYSTWLNRALLLYLAAINRCDFWVSPPEFIQEGFHLLGRFFVPTPTPSPLPLPFLLFLLSSKTLTMVPPLFHLLAGPLTIFSQPKVAI